MGIIKNLTVSLLLSLILVNQTSALSITTAEDTLKLFDAVISKIKPSQLDDLTNLTRQPNGLKEVGKILSSEGLTDVERSAVYLKICTRKGLMTQLEAEEYFKNLKEVPGFSSTIRKISGASSKGTSGHLAEIQQANAIKNAGWNVLNIGEKFNDGFKNNLTDIDLVFSNSNAKYIAEVKNYKDDTYIILDKWRADMQSLAAFKQLQQKSGVNYKSIFIVRNIPKSERVRKTLEKDAETFKVRLLYGDPENIVKQLGL